MQLGGTSKPSVMTVVNDCHCKNTALTSKQMGVYSGGKFESSWPRNEDLGYPKFCVSMWRLFHEVSTVTEQKVINQSIWKKCIDVTEEMTQPFKARLTTKKYTLVQIPERWVTNQERSQLQASDAI